MSSNNDFDPVEAATDGNARGFPLGYFVIRSLANGRVLDVVDDGTADGTQLILYNEKDSTLVESLRKRESDNQVFFIDASGALVSRHSGHAVDVQDGKLVLRHRKPIIPPFPNAVSHTLPKFSYSPVTGNITVEFDSDPAFPPLLPPKDDPPRDDPPKDDFELVTADADGTFTTSSPGIRSNPWSGSKGAQAWRQKTWLLTAIPSRKPRTFVDDAADFFTSSASYITAPLAGLSLGFGGSSTEHDVKPGEEDAQALHGRVSSEHVRAIKQFDLQDDEVLEEERPEEAEVDDNPDPMRHVRVVGYRRLADSSNTKARDRRRWEILVIRKERRRF
ncbi:SubName: Full=Uncharacterized protein {ECO:0000313/EMBL:CCA72491.1} [Serendipita indica DSM 11827]|uniref:Uncharacterized protein n=1 Tax=Serendipita indica (strain DSM 11827) TaxID=1109443 RepID=G4TME4_SERID|nr:SubName: Full=Uncharacterized protein {ECO:0000313/EMBL:CCA72491.1} [Serendipita indica DSM 11827]CCA72491.1 hypothetical protein PIIN_06426 [Serendipita indica DSM 11827]